MQICRSERQLRYLQRRRRLARSVRETGRRTCDRHGDESRLRYVGSERRCWSDRFYACSCWRKFNDRRLYEWRCHSRKWRKHRSDGPEHWRQVGRTSYNTAAATGTISGKIQRPTSPPVSTQNPTPTTSSSSSSSPTFPKFQRRTPLSAEHYQMPRLVAGSTVLIKRDYPMVRSAGARLGWA